MEIQELWRVIRQRWRTIAIMTLACLSLALGWSLTAPASYEAQSNVIISTSGSLGTASEAQYGLQVSVERAPTYAQLLQGPEVAKRASQILQGAISPKTIQDSVDARISARLPMLIVTAKSPRANDAVQIVSAAAQGLQQYVKEIERPGRNGSLTSVYLSADPPAVSRVGNPIRNAVLAGIVGFVLGILLAVYRDRTDPTVKTAGQIAHVGLKYLGTIAASESPAVLTEAFRRLAVGCVVGTEVNTGRLLIVGVDRDYDPLSVALGLGHGLVASGRKVVVIDAASKRPVDGRVGFTDVLDGSRSWAECVVQTGSDHLGQMAVGTKGGSLDALLINVSDGRRLAPSGPLRHVVVAGPSIAHASTAVALTAVADSALIVVRPGKSLVADVVEAKQILESMGTAVIGMVFVIGELLATNGPSGERPESERTRNRSKVIAGSTHEARDSADAPKRGAAISHNGPSTVTSVRSSSANFSTLE